MSNQPPTDVVTRAKAALEGVTEGPWDVLPGAPGNVWHFHDEGSPTLVVRTGGMSERDAAFIAEARGLIPELVTEVQRLRNALIDGAVDAFKQERGIA